MTNKKVMDVTKLWDYRVVRKEYDCESGDWFSVQEVYYDEDGTPMAQTLDLMVEQDTITGMRTQLESMLRALDNPVLNESDIISTSDVELDLESETKDKYIYESPDGGKTIYRRKFGESITWPREEISKEDWQKDVNGEKTSTEKGL